MRPRALHVKIIWLNQIAIALKSDIKLDTKGLICPEPLMLVRNQIREMEIEQVLHVVATDPTIKRDLDQFCRFMNHEMLDENCSGDFLEFWIKKGG